MHEQEANHIAKMNALSCNKLAKESIFRNEQTPRGREKLSVQIPNVCFKTNLNPIGTLQTQTL